MDAFHVVQGLSNNKGFSARERFLPSIRNNRSDDKQGNLDGDENEDDGRRPALHFLVWRSGKGAES